MRRSFFARPLAAAANGKDPNTRAPRQPSQQSVTQSKMNPPVVDIYHGR
jgi:hypothetical protein